ncbi:protein of unknown function [Candidatus Hydrogenisulfobacillus filiaventi]|uniref:Uncharacterized protein n=1 Tax=Candidatus Hydrogenisulfobacillus filiaventi TaxID=2707344 RepID=A0A6F8ZDJ6_9FIRM|nr:protein of unknown function [Candidatus Hydrogenisulfobacillus filiaventi]
MAARVPMPPAPSRRAGILVRLWPQPVRALGRVRVSGRTIVGVALRPPAAGTRVAVVGPVRLLGRLGPVTRCGLTYAATVEPDPEPVAVSAGRLPGTARVRRRRPAAATPPAPPPDGDKAWPYMPPVIMPVRKPVSWRRRRPRRAATRNGRPWPTGRRPWPPPAGAAPTVSTTGCGSRAASTCTPVRTPPPPPARCGRPPWPLPAAFWRWRTWTSPPRACPGPRRWTCC